MGWAGKAAWGCPLPTTDGVGLAARALDVSRRQPGRVWRLRAQRVRRRYPPRAHSDAGTRPHPRTGGWRAVGAGARRRAAAPPPAAGPGAAPRALQAAGAHDAGASAAPRRAVPCCGLGCPGGGPALRDPATLEWAAGGPTRPPTPCRHLCRRWARCWRTPSSAARSAGSRPPRCAPSWRRACSRCWRTRRRSERRRPGLRLLSNQPTHSFDSLPCRKCITLSNTRGAARGAMGGWRARKGRERCSGSCREQGERGLYQPTG